MPTDLPRPRPSDNRQRRETRVAEIDSAIASAAIPALLILLTASLPFPLVLPAFAMFAVTAGLCAGLLAVLGGLETKVATQQLRDAAGVLVLIGFGASMLTDVEGALSALAELESQYRGGASEGV